MRISAQRDENYDLPVLARFRAGVSLLSTGLGYFVSYDNGWNLSDGPQTIRADSYWATGLAYLAAIQMDDPARPRADGATVAPGQSVLFSAGQEGMLGSVTAALRRLTVQTLESLARVWELAVDRTGDQAPGPLPWGSPADQVMVGDIPQEPPGFQPRSGLLSELDRAGPGVPVVHVVTGVPGVGKTQLAAAYTRARLAEGWRLVAWVNAGDAASLLGGLARTSEAAGFSEGTTGRDATDKGRLVRHQLEADGDRCLLVFDDATDPDLLQPFVPACGAARVLITGARWPVTAPGTSVSLEVFSGDEALAFLEGRTGRVDAEGAAALAAELGQLPLALTQAAAVMAGQHLGYRAYLDRLRAVPVEESLIREVGQPPGLAQAILLSLEAIRAADHTGACARVIAIMSVLSAAGVRRDLLHAAGQAARHRGTSDGHGHGG